MFNVALPKKANTHKLSKGTFECRHDYIFKSKDPIEVEFPLHNAERHSFVMGHLFGNPIDDRAHRNNSVALFGSSSFGLSHYIRHSHTHNTETRRAGVNTLNREKRPLSDPHAMGGFQAACVSEAAS